MKQIILYDSATGNTEYLAKALSHALPNVPCGPVGSLDCSKAELVYLGFWTDKGTCSDRLRAVLPSLAGKQIFLFGTAGFGGDSAYFQRILERAEENLGPEVRVVGTYMCQGKMPPAVRRRYPAMENGTRKTAMLQNFDRAASHPDQEDLARLQAALAE